DDQPRPRGLRFTGDLDGEVLGLDEERVATTAIPFGLDLRAQPVGTMDRAAVLSVFRRLLCLTHLAIDLGAHSALRGYGKSIHSRQHSDGLPCLRLSCHFSFGWTSTPLWFRGAEASRHPWSSHFAPLLRS